MRIINVIVTDNNNGTISSADSFGIFEEQLSNDIVSQAENLFIDKCVDNKFESKTNITREDLRIRNFYREEVSEKIEEGYLIVGNVIVSIIWTDI